MGQFNPIQPNPLVGASIALQSINRFQINIPPTTPDSENNITYGTQQNTGFPYKSSLGTPVQSWCKFLGGSYSNINDGSVITIPTFVLTACLISVKQSKNIVNTKINGRNGTVKTYMGMDDYSIRITGYLLGANGVYPAADAKLLRQICNAPVSLQISCPYLQYIFDPTGKGGINWVVITGSDMNQDEGQYSIQKYTIDMLSDDNSDSIITTSLISSLNPYTSY